MNNLLSIVIVKILIFLRFFPGSLFLKNFQLLLSSFLINLKMAESFAHRPITLKSQQRPKSVFKLLNYTYLILAYIILLTSTIREVRRSSKENFSIDIWLQGCFPITIPAYCALHELRSCSFLAIDSQTDALADKVQAYLFTWWKIITSFKVEVHTSYPCKL